MSPFPLSSKWLLAIVLATALVFVAFGVWLLEPHAAHEHHDHAHDEEAAHALEAYFFIIAGLGMALFYKFSIIGLHWLLGKLYRLASFLMMLLVISSEGLMHMLSVPHLEGWWIPLMGGSAFASATAAWLYRWKKIPKPADKADSASE